ncbi:MAG: hypothetical protein IH586_23920, partial [Anaerolineaceae bacterium]|nr:hypothetical protein [Anaerolineaceae bacterium]
MVETTQKIHSHARSELERIRGELAWLGSDGSDPALLREQAHQIWQGSHQGSLTELQRPRLAQLLRLVRRVIDSYQSQVKLLDVGTVQHIGNGVATLSGLRQVGIDELVTFANGVQGLVLTLDHDRVQAILLGSDEGVHGGDLVVATGQRLRVPVGPGLIGRVINPLGQPLDGMGPLDPS